jgi:alpha-glucosidase
MNEPAVFEIGTFLEDVRHDFDGNPCSHRKGHNYMECKWQGPLIMV